MTMKVEPRTELRTVHVCTYDGRVLGLWKLVEVIVWIWRHVHWSIS